MRLNSQLLAVFLLLGCAANIWASELALKYNFVPSHASKYKTSVVKSAAKAKIRYTKIVYAALQNISEVQPNVQVVAVRNYADKQPLDPTLSYSYSQSSASIVPTSVVIPAKNYYQRQIAFTTSNVDSDLVQTYVVGLAFNRQGYDQQSVGELQRVQLKIADNPLIGCAPLSINCARTATYSKKLKRAVEGVQPKPSDTVNQRQQLPQ